MKSLRPVFPVKQAQPLLQAAASRALEASAAQDLPPHTLMQRAGMAAAKLAMALRPEGVRFFIACGPGNNGGDGLVLARLLRQAGKQVQVLLLAGSSTPPDAAWALAEARSAGVIISEALPEQIGADLVVDALLGLGLARAPEGQLAQAIQLINTQPAPVLALDLPSGLDGDTGHCLPDLCVKASDTLALLSLKPGLFTGQGRDQCGEVWFDALALEPQPWLGSADAWLTGHGLLQDWRRSAGTRKHASNKGSFGDVLVVGGAPGMRGAVRLAARAALAAGAGRVHACLLRAEAGVMDVLDRPELMSWPESRLRDMAAWRRHVVVAGCGGGDAIAGVLPDLLSQAGRLVLDADALNALAADAELRELLLGRRRRGQASVITPHPLEAARLLACSAAEVQADRLMAARKLAADLDCTVVLKGSGSIVASAGLPPCINSSGSAALATAGSGDVLAGWLAGMWAQQSNAAAGTDGAPIQQLAAAAVYWHGRAAQTQASGPLRAADLIEQMYALHTGDGPP